MKRITFWALYGLTLAALVVATDYVLYVNYITEVRARQEAPKVHPTDKHVPPSTLRRLGWVGHGEALKHSSFVNFSRAKPKGVIRIGAFGDSFTEGYEVDEFSDFPAQLSNLIAGHGITNVEVLNFGIASYGFGQTFIMWDEVGRLYDLDYILLLGPEPFPAHRDTRFNHAHETLPYWLHSRFVIENDNIRLIDVLGATPEERFHDYFRFFTRWRYLRYDRNDPAFLAAALPRNRTLNNPFYYDKRSETAEAAEIYERLLERMVSDNKPIVVGIYAKAGFARKELARLTGAHVCIAAFEQRETFPYLTPEGHDSPTQTELLAKKYLSLLLGQATEARTIRTTSLDAISTSTRLAGPNLNLYDEVQIVINEAEAGRFSTHDLTAQQSSFLKDNDYRSLIGIGTPGASILDAVFLSLPTDLDWTSTVRLVHRSGQQRREVSLGRMRRVVEGLNIGSIEIPGTYKVLGRRPLMLPSDAVAPFFGDQAVGGTMEVIVGDSVALVGEYADDRRAFELLPTQGGMYLLRSMPTNKVNEDHGQKSGFAEIVLKRGTEQSRLPIAKWHFEYHRLDLSQQCPKSWIPPLAHLLHEKTSTQVVTVVASGDRHAGDPIMRVYLNDRLLGEAEITALRRLGESQVVTYTLDNATAAGSLRIEFPNDAFDASVSGDRNLWIKTVRVNGRQLRPEHAVYDRVNGMRLKGQSGMFWPGSLTFSLNGHD